MRSKEEKRYIKKMKVAAKNKRKLEIYRKIRRLIKPDSDIKLVIRAALLNKILYLFDNENISWFRAIKEGYTDFKEAKREV